MIFSRNTLEAFMGNGSFTTPLFGPVSKQSKGAETTPLDVLGTPLKPSLTPAHPDTRSPNEYAAKAQAKEQQEQKVQAEVKRHFEEATGEELIPTHRVMSPSSELLFDDEGHPTGYIDKGIIYDTGGDIIDELPLEAPPWYLDPVEYVGRGVALRRVWKQGREIPISKDFRIAPFGNRRANDREGQLPHYHRRGVDSEGNTIPGQGIGRHRPWQTKEPDTNFLDRF